MRRAVFAHRIARVFAPLALSCTAWAEVPAAPAVESIGLTVSDLERSVAFFRDVLTFELLSEEEHSGAVHEALEGVFGLRTRVARMRLGGEEIELTEYLAPEGRPIPLDSRSNDGWFQHIAIIVSDMDAAYAHLRKHRVRHASSGPQRLPDWNPNAGGIEAFYFKDEDGHVLEVLTFPAGKGDPKWHRLERDSKHLFLGIDHTAIVVADTERSLAFYRDVLGLQVAGASENHGTEQEHLNNVFGARLRITALRGSSGPGIEFLEYLAPSDGRPFPLDARANDLLHWETRLAVGALDAIEVRLLAADALFLSAGAVKLAPGWAGLAVRDPDGHALELRGSQLARPR
ncbi:MAG: glyoxalase [Planctomycetes bacterium]|nr:glyoxalase [Planctomycetota bacterium]